MREAAVKQGREGRAGARGLAAALLLTLLASFAMWAEATGRSIDAGPLASPSGETLVVQAARLYVGDGSVIEGGAVLIENGKIAAVGANIEVPAGARVISVAGGTITPGFIDANSVAGIPNKSAYTEQASEVVPELHVLDAVDLASEEFEELAEGGVTTVFVAPDSGSVISTHGAVLKTGPVSHELRARIVTANAAVMATIGADPTQRGSYNRPPSRFGAVTFLNRRPTTRMGTVWVFREAFYEAMAYARTGKAPAKSRNSIDSLSVLAKVLSGEVPLRIQARIAPDIETALRLADEFHLRFTLVEPIEAFKVLDMIGDRFDRGGSPAVSAGRGIIDSVVYGPLYLVPRGPRAAAGEADEFCLSTPAKLAARGIDVALSAQESGGENGLRGQAIFAIRYGMPEQAALTAVTATPARILGVDDHLGMIGSGKDADLVVWSGMPFDPASSAAFVLIGGEVVAGTQHNQ